MVSVEASHGALQTKKSTFQVCSKYIADSYRIQSKVYLLCLIEALTAKRFARAPACQGWRGVDIDLD